MRRKVSPVKQHVVCFGQLVPVDDILGDIVDPVLGHPVDDVPGGTVHTHIIRHNIDGNVVGDG